MSFRTSSICVLCTTQPSITLCEGCQRRFCLECLSRHRNELSLEFDDLVNRRNELAEIMNTQLSSNTTDRCASFNEINRWQTEMHEIIDRLASTARENVRQCLSEASKTARVELDRISHDLQQKQKTGGYVEGDLNQIRQQLIKLNSIVQQFHEQIRIDTSFSKNIQWDSLLFVIPNKETPPIIPSSPIVNSSHHQRYNGNMSMPQQQRYSNTSVPEQPSYSNVSMPQHQSYSNMTMPQQRSYSIASTPTSIPRSMGNHQSSFGRSGSMNAGSRPPTTFTCIGCKTINNFNENGRNSCSVCRSPAPF